MVYYQVIPSVVIMGDHAFTDHLAGNLTWNEGNLGEKLVIKEWFFRGQTIEKCSTH